MNVVRTYCRHGVLRWRREASSYRCHMTSNDGAKPIKQVAEAAIKDASELPGPRSLPLIGTLHKYLPYVGEYNLRDANTTAWRKYSRYGPIVREEVFPGLVQYHLFDPRDIQTVFQHEGTHPNRPILESFLQYRLDRGRSSGLSNAVGPEWQRLRKGIQQRMLRPSMVASYLPHQDAVTVDLVQRIWQMREESSGEVDGLLNELYKWAMEAVGTVIFDTRLGTLAADLAPDSEAQRFVDAVNIAFGAIYQTSIFWPLHKRRNTRAWRDLCHSLDFIWDVSMKYVEQCRQQGTAKDTFLASLLHNPDLSEDDCLLLMSDMMVGGVDSTAHTTAFNLYQLAKNPQVQDLLYQEVMQAAPPGETLTQHSLNKMHYLKAVVKETARVMPTLDGTARILPNEIVLSGYKIPAGSLFMFHNSTVCRLPEHFPEPDKFLPERWMRAQSGSALNAHNFAHLPFGHGPRMCIGRRLAEQEIYLALIRIVQNFRLEYHHEDIGLCTRLINMPDKPLRLAFVLR